MNAASNGRSRRAFDAHLDAVEPALAWARAASPEWVEVEDVDLGLTEIVVNAIVHGSRASDDAEPSGCFHLVIEATDASCGFTVEWSVRACAAEDRQARDADPLATSGRGLAIAEAFFDRLTWRDDGLAVTCELHRERTRT